MRIRGRGGVIGPRLKHRLHHIARIRDAVEGWQHSINPVGGVRIEIEGLPDNLTVCIGDVHDIGIRAVATTSPASRTGTCSNAPAVEVLSIGERVDDAAFGGECRYERPVRGVEAGAKTTYIHLITGRMTQAIECHRR